MPSWLLKACKMDNRRNDKQILGQTASSGNLVDRGEQQFGASADEQLLVSIVEGDENAFAELYRRYSQGLYNYLLRLMYNSSGAEDVLQDVFLVVWQNAGSYRGGASVKRGSTGLGIIEPFRGCDNIAGQLPLMTTMTLPSVLARSLSQMVPGKTTISKTP